MRRAATVLITRLRGVSLRAAARGVIAPALVAGVTLGFGPQSFARLAEAIGLGSPAPIGVANAQERAPCARGVDSAQCVVVLIDHLRRLSFRDEVRTVLVGNPAIADVTMITATEAVISARSVGSTNMIFLNDQGLAISDFEVLVREPESQRVVLRRGPNDVALYQCAPRCERTLTQLDSTGPHQELQGVINRELSLAQGQSGGSGGSGGSGQQQQQQPPQGQTQPGQ